MLVLPDGDRLVVAVLADELGTVALSAGAAPAGALGVTHTVSYIPLDDLPTDGLAFALVPNLSFSQPVTITIHYRASDVEGMEEAELKLYLYDWSGSRWVEGGPCGGYLRDPQNNILQAVVCHFSDYALVDRPYAIYLPVVRKNL